ncbi:hypothetical protein ACIREE_13235 [Streptomyces sp. NPDC102467]|uniref:hypothetical protein n=1 Tax=Streptomyces sp. NPDC102467 TaxID=3366179 RepID=UPI0037FE3571
MTSESPTEATLRHPELARRAAQYTESDSRQIRRLLWKEATVVALVVLLLVARALWFA